MNLQNHYLIVLDALRSDHVKYMPWLSSKIHDGIYIKNLEISSGFCERSEIFFSLKPSETGFVNAINIDTESKNNIRPYSWLPNWIIPVLSFFEKNQFFQKIIRRFLWQVSLNKSSPSMYPQRIPLNILDKVILTEDSIDFEEYSKRIKSGLLYEYINAGYTINWEYFTSLSSASFGTNSSRLKTLISKLSDYKQTLIPVYISTADALGHKFGPHSKELIKGLEDIDIKLKNFYHTCMKYHHGKCDISFLGDHGMEHVNHGINIKNIIESITKSLNLKLGKDLYYFLDSTMLRIWWKLDNEKKLKNFHQKLFSNKELKDKGYFLNNQDCENEGLPPVKDIADIVWWAKKGVQVSPDFFHNESKLKAGMHGYLKKDKVSSGFFLLADSHRPQSYSNLHVLNLLKAFSI